MTSSNLPIGVFDSGLGGLTVVKALQKKIPNESIIYFGDTARVPYGNKSPDTVLKYSNEIVEFLISKNVKAIIIACNTATALALEKLKDQFPIPIMGVIEPGVIAAAEQSINKKIGVIGTAATIQSNSYKNQLNMVSKKIDVFSQACPLLVPIAEDGWMDEIIINSALNHYLRPLTNSDIDTLILGCTHYPVFSRFIKNILGNKVKLINSPIEVADSFFKLLKNGYLLNKNNVKGDFECFITDKSYSFQKIAERFLGAPILNLVFTELN